MAGITATGFVGKTKDEILTDIQGRLQSSESFGEDFDFSVGSPQRLMSEVFANELAKVWSIAGEVFYSRAIESSEGVNLNNNVKFSGIKRRQAVKSTGINAQQFNGTDGTIIPVNFVVSVPNSDVQFKTITSGTISGGSVVLNIEALIGGIAGNQAIGAITFIDSPLAGLDSTTNILATTGGLDSETDKELRERYYESLAKGGGSTTNAVRSSIIQVSGVTDALVRENDTTAPVGGVPAKSIAPVVLGGDTEEIQDAVFSTKAGGIQSFGTLTKNYTDDSGNIITIGISRPTEVDVWVNATVTSGPDYPVDGDTQVQAAIVNYVTDLEIGDDVIIFEMLLAVGNSVEGVQNVVLETSTDGITFLPADVTIADLSKAITENSKVVVTS